MFLFALASFVSSAAAQAACTAIGGECISISSCKAAGRLYVTGKCPGSVYCCLDYAEFTPCDTGTGYCDFTSNFCSGSFIAGLCLSYPVDVRW